MSGAGSLGLSVLHRVRSPTTAEMTGVFSLEGPGI